jgi:hypothetical protein
VRGEGVDWTKGRRLSSEMLNLMVETGWVAGESDCGSSDRWLQRLVFSYGISNCGKLSSRNLLYIILISLKLPNNA